MNEEKKHRLRRSMLFLSCQRPGLIQDPYVYGPDSLLLDLEDAVAENQKDAARHTLFRALRQIDYRGVERVVRINGLDTPHWREDIRASVAGGCDAIRIAKTESADDVLRVEAAVKAAEREFGRQDTLLMAAVESARGVLNLPDICRVSSRLFGVALSGGDYTKDLQTTLSKSGVELAGARQLMVIAARAAGIQCFDTVYPDLEDAEGFRREVENARQMGFDGKSLINPRQIPVVHQVFTPSRKEIAYAQKVVREIEEKRAAGIGVFTVDGKMIDIAFYPGAKRTLALARAAGVYPAEGGPD